MHTPDILRIWTAGDTAPSLALTITDSNGTARDLTGEAVTVVIGYDTPLEIAATAVDASVGQFRVDWTATDLEAGTWPVLYRIGTSDRETVRLTRNGRQTYIQVMEDLS